MSNVIEDQEARELALREEKRLDKIRRAQLRADVQAVFGLPGGRRLLWVFLQDSAADVSPLRDDAMKTAHAIGWADAAGWWLNTLRAHCPEREGQMRAEARKQAGADAREVNDDEDDDVHS